MNHKIISTRPTSILAMYKLASEGKIELDDRLGVELAVSLGELELMKVQLQVLFDEYEDMPNYQDCHGIIKKIEKSQEINELANKIEEMEG